MNGRNQVQGADDSIVEITTQLNAANISDQPQTGKIGIVENLNVDLKKKSVTDDDDDDDDNDTEYDMAGDICGKCLIFNFNFNEALKITIGKKETILLPRDGTLVDVDRLKKVFSWLRFNVVVYDDKSKQEIEEIMKRKAGDNKNYGLKCLVVCILSHGKEGGFYTTDGRFNKIENIFEIFHADNCRSVTGKPKLFFVQACQGKKDGKVVAYDGPSENDDIPSSPHFLASNADFFHFSSSTPGNVSWRSPKTGSWFVNTLCSVLEKKARKYYFDDIVLKINNAIASHAEKLKDNTIASMMCTVRQNTLHRKLKFHTVTTKFKEFKYNQIMQAS